MAEYESQKIGSRSGSGMGELMQLIEMFQRGSDREKSSTNEGLSNILELAKYATNEDSLKNVTNQWEGQSDKASKYEETNIYHNLIGGVLKDRGAQITQYSNVVDQASEIIKSADFLSKEGDFEKLPDWVKSQVDDEGNQKHDSVMQWVADEYAKIESYTNTLDSGGKLGFRRGKGIDDANISSQMNQYKNRLDATLEALIGDEAITPEEAQLIIAGDRATFIRQRDTKIRNITQGIEEYDAIIQNFDNETVLKELLEGQGIDWGDIGDTSSEREAVLEGFIREREKGIDNYKRWMGSNYEAVYKTSSQIEEEEFYKQTVVDDTLDDTLEQDGVTEVTEEDISITEKNLKKKELIKEGIIDVKTGKEFSSGEKLFASAMKGKISADEYKTILSDAGADIDTGTVFSLSNRNVGEDFFSKEHFRRIGHGEEIDILDEWLDIDKSDAGLALNDYLKNDMSLLQAANKAHSEDIKGRKKSSLGKAKSRQINSFKSKFKKSGLSLEEFTKQNEVEYRKIARLLKYAYYFKTHI